MAQTTNPTQVKPSPVSPAHHDGQQQPQHGGDEHAVPTDLKMPSTTTVLIAAGLFVLLLIALFLVGWIPSHREAAQHALMPRNAPKLYPLSALPCPRFLTAVTM